METLDTSLLLFALALLAGLVNTLAGGGGLISLPALLWVGLPPVAAVATNKIQALCGSFTATANFLHKDAIDLRRAALPVVGTCLGSIAGALLLQHLETDLLARIVPLLLITCALYFLFSPRPSDLGSRRRMGEGAFAGSVGIGLGLYNGFFGPGTGIFLAMGFVTLLGYDLRQATTHTRLLSFTGNLAALICFLPGGHMVWSLGLLMGIGQIIGAWIGSRLVLRHGAHLIRPALVVAALAVSLKLLWD